MTQSTEPPLPPELAVFRKDVGTWDAVLEVRPTPGAEPQKSRGVSRNRLRCGGRWLVVDFENETGFEGHGVYGFDPDKRKYTGVWVDPMRSFLAVMEGDWDAATRTMTMFAEAKRPDGSTMRWRELTQSIDDDTQEFRTILILPGGGEHEVVRTTYKRRA